MTKKTRRRSTSQEKVAILRLHLLEHTPVSDLCDQHGIHPTMFYRWQKEFFENATAAFEPPAPAASTTTRTGGSHSWSRSSSKHEVLSELMEEHIKLKKRTEVGRLGKPNQHNGTVPRDFWLEDWEKAQIIAFHGAQSRQCHRLRDLFGLVLPDTPLSPHVGKSFRF